MKIQGGNGGPIRPDRSRDLSTQSVDQQGRAIDPANTRTPAQVEKFDRVEISDAGRAKAAQLEPTTPGTEQRLAEVRRRVLNGAYDADAVVGEVARRIIERGDV
ncbi:MAG: flagellar biosynthesis anti-sigma factor FlgM [Gemmatimonadaceae bacterium]|nr:flagellar biosynthesis anti-sigma factor FlgM [Gemmatimonadaceae bacterium]